MASKLVVSIFFSLFALSHAAINQLSAMDALLFKPFCGRQSVQTILKFCIEPLVCPTAAAAKDQNLFGTDVYSTAKTGTVSKTTEAVATASFTIVNEDGFEVTCDSPKDSPALTKDAELRLVPIAPGDPDNKSIVYTDKGGETKIRPLTAIFSKGVTIVTRKLNVKLECTWLPVLMKINQ